MKTCRTVFRYAYTNGTLAKNGDGKIEGDQKGCSLSLSLNGVYEWEIMLTKELELLIWGMQARILQTERTANEGRWFTGVYLDVSMAGPVQLLVVL